jgi:uroporphyrinogen decarboxylase
MMLPWYRQWKRFLTEAGVPWMVVDSDGNPEALVEAWIEGGVDWILPWEANSSDILAVARRWPKLVLSGGIYKHLFEPDDPSQKGRFATNDVRQLVDAELERVVKPLRVRGGYFPSLDHWVHPGVRYRDFSYYCRRLEKSYGKANTMRRFATGRACG